MKNCKHYKSYINVEIIFKIAVNSFFFSCRHGVNACCVHCSPLESFDEVYLKEQNVKHISFHAYLRKLTAGVDR